MDPTQQAQPPYNPEGGQNQQAVGPDGEPPVSRPRLIFRASGLLLPLPR